MTCPDCKAQMVAVQYRMTAEDYDGTSEYACDSCGVRIGRWTGKRLADGELEPRYGLRREPPEAPHTQEAK